MVPIDLLDFMTTDTRDQTKRVNATHTTIDQHRIFLSFDMFGLTKSRLRSSKIIQICKHLLIIKTLCRASKIILKILVCCNNDTYKQKVR